MEERDTSGGEWLSTATYPYFIVVHLSKFQIVTLRYGHIIALLFLWWAMNSKGQLNQAAVSEALWHVCLTMSARNFSLLPNSASQIGQRTVEKQQESILYFLAVHRQDTSGETFSNQGIF